MYFFQPLLVGSAGLFSKEEVTSHHISRHDVGRPSQQFVHLCLLALPTVTQPKSHSGPVIMFSRLTYSRLYHGAFILPIAITVNGLVFLFSTPPLNLTFTSPLHLTCIGTIDNVVSAETVQVPSSSSSFSLDDVGYVSPSSQYL